MNPIQDLLRAGRFDEALAAAERAVRAAPGDAGAWCGLAASLAASQRPQQALAAWDEALARGPGAPEALCGKGAVLQSLGRVAEARALYEQALGQDPERFEAAFSLALLAVEAGDWAAADRWAAPLQARHPDLPNLRWLRGRTALGRGEFAAAHAQLLALLRDARLGPDHRADALLLLGEALEGLGRPSEAFEAAIAGKGLQRRLYAERARGREAAVARYRRLTTWFEAAGPEAWAEAPAADPVPDAPSGHVFLTGFPRSGTTLLEQALAGHPGVVTLEEAPTLAAAHAEFMASAECLRRLSALTAEGAAEWRGRYWAEVRDHGVEPAGRLFVDKAPAGAVDLPLVAKLFPQARVLFALRDPRDVVLSCLRNNFQLNAMTYAFTELAEAAACYAACMRLAQVYRARLPLAWRQVRHEALVDDFETELAAICDFLGLEADPAMLDVGATARARSVRTPSAPQVRAGLNRQGLGRWRAYERELAPSAAALAPWVAAFGYDP